MRITTIIPTLCAAGRREQLLRAIASIHAASSSRVRILVVVNGARFDPALLASLQARSDLEVIQVARGSQSHAQLVGRQAAASEFFSFLDDDDEYFPGALDLRMAALDHAPAASLVVTNGLVEMGGRAIELYTRTRLVADHPLYELFQENWLHNCNHLFRSADVPAAFFEDAPQVLEWTWLAFRLCMAGKSVATCSDLTFRYNDTPGSLSKSITFLADRVALYDRMIAAAPPRQIVEVIQRRTSSAWHDIAAHELRLGTRGRALRAHVKSIAAHWSGAKYLPFSRHLLWKSNADA